MNIGNEMMCVCTAHAFTWRIPLLRTMNNLIFGLSVFSSKHFRELKDKSDKFQKLGKLASPKATNVTVGNIGGASVIMLFRANTRFKPSARLRTYFDKLIDLMLLYKKSDNMCE